MPENFCSQHGPYDASYGACPYCSGNTQRPAAPRPLNEEDDLPTDLGYGQGAAPRYSPGAGGGDEATQIPAKRAGANFLDADDEESTQLGRAAQRDDVTQLEDMPIGVVGILWVREGQRRGQIYKINKGTTIGRKEAELILDDPKVSSLHAKLTVEDENFTLWDFGSANGTSVNGKRIREATRLHENDLIKIGDTTFVLKLLDPKQELSKEAS